MFNSDMNSSDNSDEWISVILSEVITLLISEYVSLQLQVTFGSKFCCNIMNKPQPYYMGVGMVSGAE